MLTIEIPGQVRDLVATAQRGEFPASCWATEIVSEWLYDITQHAGYDDPEKCPLAQAICAELGINEGHNAFIDASGELYRSEATKLLARALAPEEDKQAFLQVSAMVIGQVMLSSARRTIELDWDNIMPGYAQAGQYPASMGEVLPMPVWQCLMRYYANDWRDPIGAWHHDVLNRVRTHFEEISYSHDQRVPFQAST